MQNKLKKIIAVAGLSIMTLPAFANITPYYQINLIVFQRTNLEKLRPEQLINQINTKSAIWLQPPALDNSDNNATATYQLLPKDLFGLKKPLTYLKSNPRYTPIISIAWRQKFSEQKNGKTIIIQGGKLFNSTGQQINLPTTLDPNAAALPLSFWQINGTMHVSVQRHLVVDLNLNDTVPYDNGSSTKLLKTFSLKQSQNIKSDNIYYFDNPAFGAMVKITPCKNA